MTGTKRKRTDSGASDGSEKPGDMSVSSIGGNEATDEIVKKGETVTISLGASKDPLSYSEWVRPEKGINRSRLGSSDAEKSDDEDGDGDESDTPPLPVSIENVLAASKRVEQHVVKSPCCYSPKLSKMFGAEIYIKQEFKQSSGSFKERGACNALLLLNKAKRKKGVIAASAGNHALGLAVHGGRLGVPVRVVMPLHAPQTKIQNCAALGAEVILHGNDFDEATAYARKLGEEHGYEYIHGFDHPAVIAGQGSVGCEVVAQVPDADAVIVPVGGAGLMAGVSLAVKNHNPNILVLGVEPKRFPCLTAGLTVGEPITLNCPKGTIADGLAVRRVGPNCLPICREFVDKVVTVTDHTIALSMLRFIELEKTIAEGAGATCIAPFVDGQFLSDSPGMINLTGKKVVVLCCGGNVDCSILGRIIDHGLAADGRLVRIACVIDDKPGSLATFMKYLAETGASTINCEHDRPSTQDDFGSVLIKTTFEAKSHAHTEEILKHLHSKGYDIIVKSRIR